MFTQILVAMAAFAMKSKSFFDFYQNSTEVSNGCTTFTVSEGTGCEWMCNYCNTALGTNNYYFTDDVCTYEATGCEGNPLANVSYTCCST